MPTQSDSIGIMSLFRPSRILPVAMILACSSSLGGERMARTFHPADIITWERHAFTGETRYELTEVDGQPAVLASCTDGSASGLFLRGEIDLVRTPVIEWEWRVKRTFVNINEQTRAGDDYPARPRHPRQGS